MERGTGAICRRADVATRGHVTGYGQLVLKERAAASSEIQPSPNSEGSDRAASIDHARSHAKRSSEPTRPGPHYPQQISVRAESCTAQTIGG